MPFYYTPDVTEKFRAYKSPLSDDTRFRDLIFAVLPGDDFTGKEPVGNIRVLMKEGKIKEDEEIEEGEPGVVKADKNSSGYYFFKTPKNYDEKRNGPLPMDYTVKIESDFYFPIEKENINLPELKKKDLELFDKGPQAKATNSRLKDVSELDKDDVIEFITPDNKKENRKITQVDSKNKIIFWRDGLENDYSKEGSIAIAVRDPVKKIILKPKPAYPFPDNVILTRGCIKKKDINTSKSPKIRVAGRIETMGDERGEFVLYFKDGTYLFDWNKISKSDENRILKFLKRKFNISWEENPKIKKIGETTVAINSAEKYVLLELNNEKTWVDLKFEGNGKTDKLIARTENGKLCIYEQIIVEIFIEQEEAKRIEVSIMEENEKISLGEICFP